jgi:hypothetical protein
VRRDSFPGGVVEVQGRLEEGMVLKKVREGKENTQGKENMEEIKVIGRKDLKRTWMAKE